MRHPTSGQCVTHNEKFDCRTMCRTSMSLRTSAHAEARGCTVSTHAMTRARSVVLSAEERHGRSPGWSMRPPFVHRIAQVIRDPRHVPDDGRSDASATGVWLPRCVSRRKFRERPSSNLRTDDVRTPPARPRCGTDRTASRRIPPHRRRAARRAPTPTSAP